MSRSYTKHLSLEHQFQLAEESLHEAENHLKAAWYASSIIHSYQVAHRAAAGLLFGLGAKIYTDQEVRYGFSAQFVESGRAARERLEDYDLLTEMRKTAEWEHEYTATREEAEKALTAARRFWETARKLAGPA